VPTVPEDPLTPREQEVVKLIAEGHTSEEIAEMLVISKKTVERHRANILEKLGMRNRVELTRYAIRRGAGRALSSTSAREFASKPKMRVLTHSALGAAGPRLPGTTGGSK
jgi:DNA-binding CsgD family transcriptional regulator